MLTLVRRQPQQPRARFAPRSSRLAPRPPSGSLRSPPAQPFGIRVTRRCTVLRTSASATAPTSAHYRSQCSRYLCGRSCGAPPALRSSLPRAVCSAPPSVQSPRRLHRASRDGVDSPIAHTAGFTDLTARGGLGFPHPTQQAAGACHGALCRAFLEPNGVNGRPAIVGPSVCSGKVILSYWNHLIFFGHASQSIRGIHQSIRRNSRSIRPFPPPACSAPADISCPTGHSSLAVTSRAIPERGRVTAQGSSSQRQIRRSPHRKTVNPRA